MMMNAITFTETKSNGADGGQSSHYRPNHFPHLGSTHRPRCHREVQEPPTTGEQLTNNVVAAGEVALMVDCRSECRKRLGVDVSWLERGVWLVPDCCGQACCVITWLLLVYAEVVLMMVVMPELSYPYNVINSVVYNFFAFLALAAHIRATVADPGAVERGTATSEDLQRMELKEGEVVYRCPKCVCIKPPRTHHCSVCRRCIRKMDHHCPWVNNCIGEDNQKYFILFTFYTCLICVHAFIVTFAHFISSFESPTLHKMESKFLAVLSVLSVVLLLFEAIAFGIFTGCMLQGQLANVFSDQTEIEHIKKEKPRWEKKTRWASVKCVFGHPFSWRWFSPFAIPQWACSHAHLHTV